LNQGSDVGGVAVYTVCTAENSLQCDKLQGTDEMTLLQVWRYDGKSIRLF